MNSLQLRADAIAEADTANARAAAAYEAAESDHAAVRARYDALAGERAAIVARRVAGDDRADDGARLALIGVDGEILADMLAVAVAAVASAHGRATVARAALQEAGREYQAEESRLVLDALDDHTEKLVALLHQTVTQRQAAAAAMPPGDRRFDRITARLSALDPIIAGEIQVLRATPFRRLGMHATWLPSPGLYDGVWRSFNNNGAFT